MNDNILEVVDAKGDIVTIEVLKYFKLDKNKKKYIIYRKYPLINKLKTILYTAEVIEKDDSILLNDIQDKTVLEDINQIIKELYHA